MHDLHFAPVRISQVEEEIQPLLLENWEEVAKHYPQSTFAPSMQVYRDLEAAEKLAVLTARSHGELVGYAVVFIVVHPHRSQELSAVVDTFFIRPAFRKGGSALAFLRYAEDVLAGAGVDTVCFAARDPLLCRWVKSIAHYEPTETMFERRL